MIIKNNDDKKKKKETINKKKRRVRSYKCRVGETVGPQRTDLLGN